MRFMKPVMAIGALCAMMLAMTGIRRMRKRSSKKRHQMTGSRHS